MDPISAIASIVGIVGFGIQIAQILQKEIDAVQTATERVEQIVIEIRATATGLTNLQDFLLQDHEASLDDRIFNDEGRIEVAHIVRRCNTVFRNITVLVAKAGNAILSSVEQFQRQVEEEHNKKKGPEESAIKLDIELSNLEHLMWPWRLPKIEQYIADLDRLKLSLVLILSVANLAKTKKQKKIKDNHAESEKWEGSQAETLVQDEIFYQDRGLQEAEKNYKTLTVGVSPGDRVTQSTHRAAQVLIANWPDSPSGRGTSSTTELHESGVILEGFAFNPDDFEQDIIEMPLNLRSMQDHALNRRRWGSRKPLSVWDAFARLPNYQQEIILKFIAKRKGELYGNANDGSQLSPQLVLISLNVAKYRWQRSLEALKRFRDFNFSTAPQRSTLFIVIARMAEPRRTGPEPLISSMTPGRPPFNGGGPRTEDGAYTDSTSSNHPSLYSSRSRRRSRVRYPWSRSRSRTRSYRPRFAIAAARALKAAYKDRKSKRLGEERRPRSRSRRSPRRRRYPSYYTYYPPPPPPDHPRPETEAPKTGDQGNDETRLHCVTTLNGTDGNDPSSIPPSRPELEPPPPTQRTTTFQKDADRGEKSFGEQAIAALHSRNTSRKERDASPAIESSRARRNTVAKSSRDARTTRAERSRRDRSRSRSSAMVQRPRTWRRRSSSDERSDRRNKKEKTVMQLFRKSPERPMLRTYINDGVPPTQRDKAAVAEYYLKKWTTAYDHVRAQNRERRYTTRATGRSRSRFRYVPVSRLIEYGDTPVYRDQANYPPPPGQEEYYAADPYQGPYNPAEYPPAGASGYEARKPKKREEMERERRASNGTSESDDGRRRRHRKKEDTESATPKLAQTYGPRPTPGRVHSVSTDSEDEEEESPIRLPVGLVVPSDHRAYAESVPDNGYERQHFVDEDV